MSLHFCCFRFVVEHSTTHIRVVIAQAVYTIISRIFTFGFERGMICVSFGLIQPMHKIVTIEAVSSLVLTIQALEGMGSPTEYDIL